MPAIAGPMPAAPRGNPFAALSLSRFLSSTLKGSKTLSLRGKPKLIGSLLFVYNQNMFFKLLLCVQRVAIFFGEKA